MGTSHLPPQGLLLDLLYIVCGSHQGRAGVHFSSVPSCALMGSLRHPADPLWEKDELGGPLSHRPRSPGPSWGQGSQRLACFFVFTQASYVPPAPQACGSA